MTSVVFVVGHCDSEKAYQDFMFDDPKGWSIKNKIQNRLPAGTPMLITRWDNLNLIIDINNFVKSNKLILIGFSYGGHAALIASKYLKKQVEKLILIDPVVMNGGIKASSGSTGFVVCSNVKDCTCYYRIAQDVPWSNKVTSADIPANGQIKVENINYPCDGKNPWADHGKMVWSQDLIDLIKGNL